MNEDCLIYNELVFRNEEFGFDAALEYLKTEGFDEYINSRDLQNFDNQILEMDFYPAIDGRFLKDNQGNFYMLIAVQKYDQEGFTSPLLFQFNQQSFYFPHQDNYF